MDSDGINMLLIETCFIYFQISKVYHESTTELFARLVAVAMEVSPHASFEDFMIAHPHLKTPTTENEYYSKELLNTSNCIKS